ncbi:spore coat protein [Virgibacillus sp. MSJ-26]|uniref:CotY/CotZ family spore coat protein n=1 Tax=Virgibacillus sp. MSJ-26 TaxID=2841522 RepID=UPI001C1022AE|nr:CotY/CotZ family spore coat protein [Virgibacillus sp. MSJ-26]MBU5468506.1 spore coat protein [Virgibacillus sp. MSJ-26]
MGCKCGKDFDTGSCVCDVLREIADAQSDVVENCCDTSCEQSINDLLGEKDSGSGLDTVPVILYCQDGCKPFKGFGAGHMPDGTPGPIEASFIFRVKSVDEDCCAVLELVRNAEEPCTHSHLKDPADQGTDNLYATGICITVDLKCFCHVTCLPAVSLFQ